MSSVILSASTCSSWTLLKEKVYVTVDQAHAIDDDIHMILMVNFYQFCMRVCGICCHLIVEGLVVLKIWIIIIKSTHIIIIKYIYIAQGRTVLQIRWIIFIYHINLPITHITLPYFQFISDKKQFTCFFLNFNKKINAKLLLLRK